MTFLLFSPRHGADVAHSEYLDFLGATGLQPHQLEQRMLDARDSTLGDLNGIDGIFVGGSPYTITDSTGHPYSIFHGHGTDRRPSADERPRNSVDVDGVNVVAMHHRVEDIPDDPDDALAEQKAVCGQLALLQDVDIPVIYICFGAHLLAQLGGGVITRNHPEDSGPTVVRTTPAAAQDPLMKDLPAVFSAFTGHTENIEQAPADAVVLATGDATPVQVYRVGAQQWATQFHAEMDADGLRRRMEFYLDYGYFSKEEFHAIVDRIQSVDVSAARQILANFVEYCRR